MVEMNFDGLSLCGIKLQGKGTASTAEGEVIRGIWKLLAKEKLI